MSIREVEHPCEDCGSVCIHYCSKPAIEPAPKKEEAKPDSKVEARLKAVVEALGKIIPTWTGQGIKAEDLSKACELLKAEGWSSPKWEPPPPEYWEKHYDAKKPEPEKESDNATNE